MKTREALTKACAEKGLRLVLPEKRYCTANAAMIASEGLVQYRLGNFADMSLTAKASIPLAATLKTVQNKKVVVKTAFYFYYLRFNIDITSLNY